MLIGNQPPLAESLESSRGSFRLPKLPCSAAPRHSSTALPMRSGFASSGLDHLLPSNTRTYQTSWVLRTELGMDAPGRTMLVSLVAADDKVTVCFVAPSFRKKPTFVVPESCAP